MNTTSLRNWILLTTALFFSSCDNIFDPFHHGWGGNPPPKATSKIYFAADTVDPRRMPPFPVYDVTSSQIFSVNADGSDLRQLTNSGAYSGQPSVSKNGRRIVFVGTSRIPTFVATGKDLFVMDSDGKNERWLTNLNSNFDEYEPAISPDGDYIAFISTRDGNPELYVGSIADNDAQPFRVTTTDSVDESSPAWSPDGKWLTYISQKGLGTPTTLWMRLNPTRLWPAILYMGPINIADSVRVRDPSFIAKYNSWESPDWSPDGKLIAFAAHYEGMLEWYIHPGVFTLKLSSYTIAAITGDSNFVKRWVDPRDPNWSPDGKRLIVAMRTGVESYQLEIFDASGTWRGAIVPASNRRYWQPDWGAYAPRESERGAREKPREE
jgi:Tol biopolymer transport system component